MIFDPLIKPEEIQRAGDRAVNCARCENISDFKADKQVGWCLKRRVMVSTWHPVLCDLFEQAE